MTPRSYLCDSSWERFGNTVLAGSPFVVFRTTDAGARVLDALEAGEPVADSKLIDRLLDAGAVHPAPTLHPTAFTLDDVTVVTPQLGGAASADGRIVVDDGSQPPIQSATLRLEINRGPGGARTRPDHLLTRRWSHSLTPTWNCSQMSGSAPGWTLYSPTSTIRASGSSLRASVAR